MMDASSHCIFPSARINSSSLNASETSVQINSPSGFNIFNGFQCAAKEDTDWVALISEMEMVFEILCSNRKLPV